MLAFVALGNLPVNWGGVILVVLSVIVFIVDVKVNSFVLTAGGLLMFILGGLLLFTPLTPQAPTMPTVSVSPLLLLALGAAMAVFFLFLLGAAVRGRNFPVLTGVEAMAGTTGLALSDFAPEGTVRVKSEEWTATAPAGTIKKGDSIKVIGVEGLKLKVVKE